MMVAGGRHEAPRIYVCSLPRRFGILVPLRGIIIVVAVAMVLMPIKVSHAGWLSDLFKGSKEG